MGRKAPVKHTVHQHLRKTEDGLVPVKTHNRGHGQVEIKQKRVPVPKYLKGISLADNVISEGDLLKLKNRLSHGIVKISDVEIPEGGWKITPEQTKKGHSFLMGLWKKSDGREREDSPFGYREQDALENFKEFRVIDFWDAANYTQNQMGIHFYQPYYRVIGKDNDFEYAYYAGEIHIMG